MHSRRKFLANSLAAAAGSMFLSKAALAEWNRHFLSRPVGLQLFTFFGIIDEDVPGTIKKIADIGYTQIESAFSKKGGFYGMKGTEFAALLKDNGMSWKSHHVLGAPFKMPAGYKMPKGPDGKPMTIPPMRNLKENRQELVDEVAAAGIPWLVCANIPTGTTEEITDSIKVLNATADLCKKANINFAYHNHDMEFKTIDGDTPYHRLLSETDPSSVKMELDLAWATKAGVNPVDLFRKYPGRFPLWHAKDISKDLQTIEPVGEGIVDFKTIFAAASVAGMEYFFVEHDMPKDAYASITTSITNLKKILS